MPITGPASYPPTINDFLAHWTDAHEALGVGHEIILANGAGIGDLEDSQTAIENTRGAVTDLGVNRLIERGTLTALITKLQAQLVEFNAKLRANLPLHPLLNGLPDAFTVGEAEGTVREALRKMSYLWTKVNAISPSPIGVTLPLTLVGAVTRAAFDADRETLRLAFKSLSDADVDLDVARAARDVAQTVVYEILKFYRLKVQSDLRDHPELIAALPRLTPEAGSTPAAVTAHVVWDAGAETAKVTWAASSEPDLRSFQVRGVPGDDYNSDDETVLATVLPGAPREFSTGFGLSAAGLTAGFKVYVVLNSGNEKGSEAVYLTRPS